jgi:hypothetical protein
LCRLFPIARNSSSFLNNNTKILLKLLQLSIAQVSGTEKQVSLLGFKPKTRESTCDKLRIVRQTPTQLIHQPKMSSVSSVRFSRVNYTSNMLFDSEKSIMSGIKFMNIFYNINSSWNPQGTQCEKWQMND